MSRENSVLQNVRRQSLLALTFAVTALVGATRQAHAQATQGLLVSREELTARAERAESASMTGDEQSRSRSALAAASIRQRLREGDFQVGDRVIVKIVSDKAHVDTVVVRSGHILDLPDKMSVSVDGVLRSELRDRVAYEVLKYVKATEIEVTPLMRVGILGEVSKPGYFALASDIPITDAIMGAGGPTTSADLEASIVRRGTEAIRSAEETRTAIAHGLTLDQFGLNAGDELVVGRRHETNAGTVLGMLGSVAAIFAVVVAAHH